MWKMIVLLSIMVLLTGCAALSHLAAPSQVDAQGQIIPGTHQASAPVEQAAGLIPFGSIVLNGILLAWNGVEKYRSKKTTRGLKSTLLALNQVRKDPDLRAQWEKIRKLLEASHQAADVQPMIDNLLAKI